MENNSNNRRDFLRKSTMLSAATLLPLGGISNLIAKEEVTPLADCVLIPSETAGPFPLDLSENSFFLRQDIRETQEGVPLNLKLKIIV